MTTAADLVAKAKAAIRESQPQDIAPQLGKLTVVDVREADEFAAGHIPGAIHIPRGLLEFKVDAHPVLRDRNRRIAMQCQGGGRSALATLAMQELGYTDVVNLAGGFAAWKAAGLPVET